jgi:hypothetical protein
MNCSAASPGRKWPIAALGRGKEYIKKYIKGADKGSAIKGSIKGSTGSMAAPMVTVMAVLAAWLVVGTPAVAARRSHPGLFGDLFGERPARLRGSVNSVSVPLPQPRPAEAPSVQPQAPATAKAAPTAPEKPAGPAAAVAPTPVPSSSPAPAPQPSACRLALTEEIAIAPSIPDIHDPGGCGGEDLVRLEAVVLPDKHRVSLKPAATMRCGMATAIAEWVRSDIEPIAEGLGSRLADLDNYDSYDCRGRNGIAGALLSEHGRANALDVRGWKLANGQSIGLTDRNAPRELRESVLHSVCTRFTTVLGPGSDGYHEDHIHLDLMERRNNYKICQWNVWDPMPQVAPLMPAERPAEAPPRQIAVRDGADGRAEGAAAKPDTKPETKPAESAEPHASEKANADDAKQDDSQSDKSNSDKSKSGKSSASKSSLIKSNATNSNGSKSESSKSESSKSESTKSDSSKPESGKPQSDPPQPDKPATKKRRQDRRS